MNNDAALGLIGLGVLVGGATIGKAALDEILDPHKAQRYADDKRLKAIPKTTTDKVVQFVVVSVSLGGAAMRLYDWLIQGKTPKAEDLL